MQSCDPALATERGVTPVPSPSKPSYVIDFQESICFAVLADPLLAIIQLHYKVLSDICQRDCDFVFMPPGEHRRAYNLIESNRDCLAAVLAAVVMSVSS